MPTGFANRTLAALSALAELMPWRGRVREQFETADGVRRPHGADGVVIGAESIRMSGSATHAALLVHGFNDTPQSMRVLATALHANGWSVVVPRLPGHGCALPDMAAHASATEWTSCVRDEYARLRQTYAVVAVCGLSMGGALSASLAADHREIPVLVLLAPYIGVPRFFGLALALSYLRQVFQLYQQGSGGARSLHDPVARARALAPGILTARMLSALKTIAEQAEAALPLLHMPILYLQSREDNRISVRSAVRNFSAIGSANATHGVREQRWLTGCGHIITADYCREDVARQVCEWFARHAGAPQRTSSADTPGSTPAATN